MLPPLPPPDCPCSGLPFPARPTTRRRHPHCPRRCEGSRSAAWALGCSGRAVTWDWGEEEGPESRREGDPSGARGLEFGGRRKALGQRGGALREPARPWGWAGEAGAGRGSVLRGRRGGGRLATPPPTDRSGPPSRELRVSGREGGGKAGGGSESVSRRRREESAGL